MPITFRLVASLIFSASIVVSLATLMQVRDERARLIEDLQKRSSTLAQTSEDGLVRAHEEGPRQLRLQLQRLARREHLPALAVFDHLGEPIAATGGGRKDLEALKALARETAQSGAAFAQMGTWAGERRHLFFYPFQRPQGKDAVLLIARDSDFVSARTRRLWKQNFVPFFIQAILISLITLWVIRWNVLAPAARLADWMKRARAGDSSAAPPYAGMLQPVINEAAKLAKSLSAAKKAAEVEARLREKAESVWTAERLKEHVKGKLGGKALFVVANREPYAHTRHGKRVDVVTPASGLVTGIEPILRACGGTWVAHGSGDADRDVVDERGRIPVPPEEPQYTLKRVWLSKEEEEGYYYGFSNEGLWPLCHIAYTRPVFREEDWAHYKEVNRKFADALLEEMADVKEPYVLIQDYHYALLPRMIKDARPDARVAIFWHIPWPNPEAFGICPWQSEILHGMLGADIIGFHIQFHCNNFLETVDRALESRIDWERFAVEREGHITLVRPHPISIAFPSADKRPARPLRREELLEQIDVQADFIGVGVDRVDYTKGIVERFRAVERFLEKNPKYHGKFVFIELGEPSRTHIKRYHDLVIEVEQEAERINWKFGTRGYKPIVLQKRHHNHNEIEPYYRAADLCMVTSLHDGMNLVAKEFVAARDDEKGVLILSRFTGASRELREALIVNPYDIEQMADAIRAAIELDPEEQARRMAAMRAVLREQNVYLWASRLIEDMSKIEVPSEPDKLGIAHAG